MAVICHTFVQQGLSHSTMQVYLHVHSLLLAGCCRRILQYPDNSSNEPAFKKGIRKSQATTRQPYERQPITFPIRECLHTALSKHTRDYYIERIWAACTTYFNLLRISEFMSTAHHIHTVNTSGPWRFIKSSSISKKTTPPLLTTS